MRILITGGTVFVSKKMAEYFVGRGDQVFVMNRGTHEQVQGVSLIKADRYSIGAALENLFFDAVIAVNTYDENDMAELLRALKTDGLFSKKYRFGEFVFISSSAVYPEVNVQPFNENQSAGWNRIWKDYGINKVQAEELLRKKVKNAYIVRPPYLYGEGNNVYRESFVFDCAENDRKFYVPGDGSMKMQFFDVRDLCGFVSEIIEKKPEYHIFNVGNEKSVSIKDWVNACYKVCGKVPEFVEVDKSVESRKYFPFYDYEYCLNVSRMKEIFTPEVSLEKGLKASYEYYKAHKNEVNRHDYFSFIDSELVQL